MLAFVKKIFPPIGKKGILLACGVFLGGLIITLAIVMKTAQTINDAKQVAFDNQVKDITLDINTRFLLYTNLLRSTRSFLTTAGNINQPMWEAYVASLNLSKNYPDIVGLGYVAHITDAQKQALITKEKVAGITNFSIFPTRKSATHDIVVDFYPRSNVQVLGYDFSGDLIRSDALQKARDSGEVAFTGKVTILLDANKGKKIQSVIIVFPVYKSNTQRDTALQRQDALIGYIVTSFRVDEFMQSVLAGNRNPLLLSAYDTDTAKKVSSHNLLFTNFTSSLKKGMFSREISTTYGGRPWMLSFASVDVTTPYDVGQYLPVIRLAGGIGISILVALLVYFLSTAKERAERLAEKLTEKLRISEQKYRTIFETLQDVYYQTDMQGVITIVSPSITNYTGLPVAEIVGKPATVFYKDAMQREIMLKELMQQGEVHDYEILLSGKNDLPLHVSVTAQLIKNADGNPVAIAGILRDITRRKQAEEKLQALNEQLKKDKKVLEEAMTKDEFLSMAAHQLRTPLGTQRWSLEMLLKGTDGRLSPKVKETVTNLYEENLKLIALVNDLLDVSRINQHKIKENPVVLHAVAMVESIVETFSHSAKEKQVRIVVEKPKETISPLLLDAELFTQVIQNLLSNSIKYNKPHGKVTISFSQKGKFLQISVADTGIGIPQKDQKSIFEKFKRGSNVPSKNYEGSGLGLFVVKSYITHWRGAIHLKSKLNTGTTIAIDLPIHKQ